MELYSDVHGGIIFRCTEWIQLLPGLEVRGEAPLDVAYVQVANLNREDLERCQGLG